MFKRVSFLITICVVLHIPNSLWAQKNDKKGFAVTNENDTIRGLVSVSMRPNTQHQCHIIDNNQKRHDFYPFQVKSVKTDNKYYVSREVDLDNTKKVLFVEVLYKGYITLYKLDKENFFIAKGDSLYHLNIIEKEVVSEKNGILYSVKLNKYQGMLNYLFSDEPSMKSTVNHTKLTAASLVKVSKQYSSLKCDTNSVSQNYVKDRTQSISIEPQTGLNYSALMFKTSNDYLLSLSPIIGISLHFTSNYFPQIEFIANATYTKFHLEGDFTHTIYKAEQTSRVDLNYSTISIPLMAKFLLGKRKLQPSITLGLSSTFLFQENCSLHRVILNEGDEIYVAQQSPNMRKFQIGVVVGLGLNYRLNNKSSIHLNCDFEYRRTAINTHYLLDKQQLCILQPRIGYSYKFK